MTPCTYTQPEAGLHAVGNNADQTYFDDLGVNFPTSGTGTGVVIQY